jgi:hypothetical protein
MWYKRKKCIQNFLVLNGVVDAVFGYWCSHVRLDKASHLPSHAEADILHANKPFVKENEPDSEFKLAEPIRTE